MFKFFAKIVKNEGQKNVIEKEIEKVFNLNLQSRLKLFICNKIANIADNAKKVALSSIHSNLEIELIIEKKLLS